MYARYSQGGFGIQTAAVYTEVDLIQVLLFKLIQKNTMEHLGVKEIIHHKLDMILELEEL